MCQMRCGLAFIIVAFIFMAGCTYQHVTEFGLRDKNTSITHSNFDSTLAKSDKGLDNHYAYSPSNKSGFSVGVPTTEDRDKAKTLFK